VAVAEPSSEIAPGKLTRQELYDRIRETSKEEYILSEMKRLGFWPKDSDTPSPAEQAISRQVELETELRDLLKRKRSLDDPESALKEMRKRRMRESREKQEANRIRRNEERYERSKAWHEKQQSDITYLGEGLSYGLRDNQSDKSKLASQQLPVVNTAEELAAAMGVAIGELRFLAYSKKVSRVSHYKQFFVKKKSGGERRICAPMPRLKHTQYWVLENLLNKIPLHNAAHGFATGRSIVSNAQPHVAQSIVINMDLKDFFPTISYQRVKGLIRKLGYSEQVATIIALLLTEPQCDEVELHSERYFVANGARLLPQGSPASPAISNIICRRLDHRMSGMAASLGFVYTRYADDMTFSASDASSAANIKKLVWRTHSIVQDEGFTVHPDKTRVMRKGARQEVTGIVVNEKPNISREKLRKFRAAVHKVEKDGWKAARWGGSTNVQQSMLGYANFIAMVDPEKGQQYKQRLQAVSDQSSSNIIQASKLGNRYLRSSAAAGKQPEGWWQPQVPEAPILEQTQQQKDEARRASRIAATQTDSNENGHPAGQGGENSDESDINNNEPPTHIDPETGRFKPSWLYLLTMFMLLAAVGVVTKVPAVIAAGGLWALTSYFLWRQSMFVRLAVVVVLLPILYRLLRVLFVG